MDAVLAFMFSLIFLGLVVVVAVVGWRMLNERGFLPPPRPVKRGLVVKEIDLSSRRILFIADYGTAMELMEYGGVHSRGRDMATRDLWWELHVSEFSDFTGTVLVIQQIAYTLTPPPLRIERRNGAAGHEIVQRGGK